MDGWGGGWMWFWATLTMLSWVAIIAVAVYLLTRRSSGAGPQDRVREILDERYARGEITAEEYREKLSHLGR
jgi:putative membrane protein